MSGFEYSQSKGRLRLRHLMERTEAVDEEMCEEASRFQRLAKDSSKPAVVSSFNLFQTPEAIADQMVAALGDKRGRTLEPSAGLGRLYRAWRKVDKDSYIVLVDDSKECCGQLYRETEGDHMTWLHCADFLQQTTGSVGTFDCILMNPPFKMGTDIKHIMHATSLLRSGGKLVALCANGPRQRDKLQPIATTWQPLPYGSFKEVGTRVDVAMLTINN